MTKYGHVIITGAAGFIGGACVREFLDDGWLVTALIHRCEPENLTELLGNSRLHFIRGSIEEKQQLIDLVSGTIENRGPCDALIHCAGRASDLGRDLSFRRAILTGVENICALVKSCRIGRLVHISTTDVYGVRDFDTAGEDTPLQNNRHNPYPKYKILAEEAIRTTLHAEQYTIIRPALVWGPGDTTVLPRAVDFLRKSPFIIHFGKWKGRNHWPLAYVGNVSRVIRVAAASERSAGKIYNVSDPEETSMEDYYRLLIKRYLPDQLGKRTITLPFWTGWVAGIISTFLSNLFDCKLPLFDPTLYGLFHISHSQSFDNRRSIELLESAGLNYIPRDAALELFENSEQIPGRS